MECLSFIILELWEKFNRKAPYLMVKTHGFPVQIFQQIQSSESYVFLRELRSKNGLSWSIYFLASCGKFSDLVVAMALVDCQCCHVVRAVAATHCGHRGHNSRSGLSRLDVKVTWTVLVTSTSTPICLSYRLSLSLF